MKYDPSSVAHRQFLAQSLMAMLFEAGFKKEHNESTDWRLDLNSLVYTELAFVREDKKNGFFVKVYTSIARDDDGGYRMRRYSSDAIRIKSYNSKERKGADGHDLYVSMPDIYRQGDIEKLNQHVLEKMRECWKMTIEHIKKNKNKKCPKCGASTFVSKKGNIVCSDICWDTKKKNKWKKKRKKKAFK